MGGVCWREWVQGRGWGVLVGCSGGHGGDMLPSSKSGDSLKLMSSAGTGQGLGLARPSGLLEVPRPGEEALWLGWGMAWHSGPLGLPLLGELPGFSRAGPQHMPSSATTICKP